MLMWQQDRAWRPRPKRMLQVSATAFAADRQCLYRLRGWVHARLATTPFATDIDAILIGVNELAGNALKHTASGEESGSFIVTLVWDASTIRTSVTDQGGNGLPELHVPDTQAESGRGLLLVAGLAARWGWQETAFGCDVWFEVDHKNPAAKDESA